MNALLCTMKFAGQNPVLIINAPEELNEPLKEIASEIHRTGRQKYAFILFFSRDLSNLRGHAKEVIESLDNDGYLWVCYPKRTSKRYMSDIKREKVKEVFGSYDFEGVTQVAIDDDWSALRMRHVDNIKTMKRKKAFGEKGKKKASPECAPARKKKSGAGDLVKTDTMYEWL
jgi:hypothetical protein